MSSIDHDVYIPAAQWTQVHGTFGRFMPPGGQIPVSYVLTYASLADEGTGNTRLTRDLLPVRELFDVTDLDFSELLQRDIDDHRVATQIIPYLLRDPGYAKFFPPIVAVVAPAKGKKLEPFYPIAEPSTLDSTPAGRVIDRETFGDCFEIDRTRDAKGNYAPTATLKYNPDRSRLVVIDGQHRAMAMLAIRRCRSGEWGDRGSAFKHFYQELAVELTDQALLSRLGELQLPVCVCFFPTLMVGAPVSAIQACRKLFLDVNRQAKKPTRARQLLLDDLSMVSVLVRALLGEVRSPTLLKTGQRHGVDLDSFEYDSPRDAPQPRRPLAISTVEMLQAIVEWTSFAPDEYHVKLGRKPGAGKRSKANVLRFLREIAVDQNIPAKQLVEFGYTDIHKDFDPEEVPSAAHGTLTALYMHSWGRVLIEVFSKLHPFKVHAEAVAALRAAHMNETGHGQLANRALFDGQGVFWTLEYYARARKRLRSELRKTNQELPELDIERAYASIMNDWIPKGFAVDRASRFWSRSKVEEWQQESAERSYRVFRTIAFQVGIFMAFSYLKDALALQKPADFLDAAQKWIDAWNSTLTNNNAKTDSNTRTKRLMSYDRGLEEPTTEPDAVKAEGIMNLYVGQLKPTDWFWFRYFAFECLAASGVSFPGKEVVQDAAERGRWRYIDALTEHFRREQRRMGLSDPGPGTAGAPGAPAVSEVQRNNDPEKLARERWRHALNFSVGLTQIQFDQWLKKGPPKDAETLDDDDSDSEDDLVETSQQMEGLDDPEVD